MAIWIIQGNRDRVVPGAPEHERFGGTRDPKSVGDLRGTEYHNIAPLRERSTGDGVGLLPGGSRQRKGVSVSPSSSQDWILFNPPM